MDRNPLNGLPTGLSMALAQNIYAMEYFISLPESGRKDIIRQTEGISSRGEMQQFVNSMIKH